MPFPGMGCPPRARLVSRLTKDTSALDSMGATAPSGQSRPRRRQTVFTPLSNMTSPAAASVSRGSRDSRAALRHMSPASGTPIANACSRSAMPGSGPTPAAGRHGRYKRQGQDDRPGPRHLLITSPLRLHPAFHHPDRTSDLCRGPRPMASSTSVARVQLAYHRATSRPQILLSPLFRDA
jgi:hypothetical protein